MGWGLVQHTTVSGPEPAKDPEQRTLAAAIGARDEQVHAFFYLWGRQLWGPGLGGGASLLSPGPAPRYMLRPAARPFALSWLRDGRAWGIRSSIQSPHLTPVWGLCLSSRAPIHAREHGTSTRKAYAATAK